MVFQSLEHLNSFYDFWLFEELGEAHLFPPVVGEIFEKKRGSRSVSAESHIGLTPGEFDSP